MPIALNKIFARVTIITISFSLFSTPVFCAERETGYLAEEEVRGMLNNLHWLGHAGFRCDGSKRIYFDPYQIPQDSPAADIIFITHEHFDHCSPDDLKLISNKDTVIVTSWAAAGQLQRAKLLYKEIKPLRPGDNIEISGIKINAVSSYNIGKPNHPKNSGNVGFIVQIDGVKIYHAGDTDLIPEMKDYRCDIALLPVCGRVAMSAEEAAQAALMIKPEVAIPMHYGSVIGSEDDAIRFKDLLKGKLEVKILNQES